MRISEEQIFKIHLAFSASPFGQKLDRIPRYRRFMPKDIGQEEWKALIGPDANSLLHLAETYLLFKKYLPLFHESGVLLTDEVYSALATSAVIHGWWQASDASAPLPEQMPEICSRISEEIEIDSGLKTYVRKAAALVLGQENQRLFSIYDAIKRLGYLENSKTAWHNSIIQAKYSDCLKCLCNNVLLSHIPVLLKYAEKFQPIKTYLEENHVFINEMFYNMTDSSFNIYPEKEQEESRKQFLATKILWINETS